MSNNVSHDTTEPSCPVSETIEEKEIIQEIEEDEDEDEDEDEWAPGEYGYSTFIGTDKWEDQKQLQQIKAQKNIPESWYIIKIVDFSAGSFTQMIEWCEQNCSHQYQKVGWSTGCSRTVGMAIEDEFEALMFKMRFM